MDSSSNDVARVFRFFKVLKDGSVHFFMPPTEKIPPSDNPKNGVRSKDVVISSDPPVSARIFLPPNPDPTRKLPLLFYIHGGGFCMQSAFSPGYHDFLTTVVAEANSVAVSVEYGLFPDRPIPACYDDSWAAFQWVASHACGDGPEPWLNDFADFRRVFIAGDSAGGNISHTVSVRVGSTRFPGLRVVGVVLVHPYFGGTDDDQMWLYMCPSNGGLEDPRLKPAAEDLARIGCDRVLVFVAEKDHLRKVGIYYHEELKKSGWKGTVEIVENEGEDHCFHMFDPTSEKAADLIKRIVSFINRE
ncbi:probable carboxylesterase 4, mitochondrial [Malania oleifera]|uniref:probable carboxylesterase 4, mitochondrial n=1 Tax=Malania oleifera TaxID=397392 RepID=UPI0025ADF5EB|nr:probable carboxylesterase 4, mitochondrial [Malania oleifera]